VACDRPAGHVQQGAGPQRASHAGFHEGFMPQGAVPRACSQRPRQRQALPARACARTNSGSSAAACAACSAASLNWPCAARQFLAQRLAAGAAEADRPAPTALDAGFSARRGCAVFTPMSSWALRCPSQRRARLRRRPLAGQRRGRRPGRPPPPRSLPGPHARARAPA